MEKIKRMILKTDWDGDGGCTPKIPYSFELFLLSSASGMIKYRIRGKIDNWTMARYYVTITTLTQNLGDKQPRKPDHNL